MKVEYIEHMGTDLSVVDAARVSFDKKSAWEYEPTSNPNKWSDEIERKLSARDTKLINSLARDKHWTPFAHCILKVRVTAPIFIANQLKRHQIGLALNEVSRRYVDDEPTFYTPDEWRGRPPGSIKQGSSDEIVTDITSSAFKQPLKVSQLYNHFIHDVKLYYKELLEAGIAPEMARMVLPQSMNTSWIWTGSLAAFCRVYKQRSDSHAQKESQIIAGQIGAILTEHFPVSFEALTNAG